MANVRKEEVQLVTLTFASNSSPEKPEMVVTHMQAQG